MFLAVKPFVIRTGGYATNGTLGPLHPLLEHFADGQAHGGADRIAPDADKMAGSTSFDQPSETAMAAAEAGPPSEAFTASASAQGPVATTVRRRT